MSELELSDNDVGAEGFLSGLELSGKDVGAEGFWLGLLVVEPTGSTVLVFVELADAGEED